MSKPQQGGDVAMGSVSERNAKNLRKLARNQPSDQVRVALSPKSAKEAKDAADSLRKKGATMTDTQKHNIALLTHLEKMNMLLEKIATPEEPAPEETLHAKLWTDFGKLVTAGLSFVAGLAWKDFFKEAFDLEPISAHVLVNQLVYAMLVTVISIVAIYVIMKFVDKMSQIDYAKRVKAFDDSLKISAGFLYLDEIIGVTREWNEIAEAADDVLDRLGLDTDSEAEEEAGAGAAKRSAKIVDDSDDLDDDRSVERSAHNHTDGGDDHHH